MPQSPLRIQVGDFTRVDFIKEQRVLQLTRPGRNLEPFRVTAPVLIPTVVGRLHT